MRVDGEKKKSRGPVLFIALIIMAVAIIGLGIAFLATTISYKQYKAEAEKTIATMENMDEVVEEAVKQEEVIKMDTFKGYANQYGVSIEFLQRFFEDKVVYKDNGTIIYEPIDESIPKNALNLEEGLVRVDGKLQYQENGVNVAKKGIDVSKHQGNINWKKVAATGDVDYAIIRLGYRGYTEGKILLDETFHANMKGAIAAKIPVGVYFYSQAITVEEALEEAAYVIEQLKPYKLDYPVVFDSEEVDDDEARTNDISKEVMTDMTIAFCDAVEAEGYIPMVYGNVKWMMAKIDLSRLTKYDKWFAQYFNTPFFPYELAMWQYTATGKIDGITGDVDFNLCFKEYVKEEPKTE